MEHYVYWFVLGLIFLGVELATGTFYMLVLAIALGAGGVAALTGFIPELQYVIAAAIGLAGTLVLRRFRMAAQSRPSQDQSLDLGQPVKVLQWREDGAARVHYRGADWDAELASTDAPREGPLYIREVRGNTLILTHEKGK
jgi:Membrane protein implicated in regulation of membrane protease activity